MYKKDKSSVEVEKFLEDARKFVTPNIIMRDNLSSDDIKIEIEKLLYNQLVRDFKDAFDLSKASEIAQLRKAAKNLTKTFWRNWQSTKQTHRESLALRDLKGSGDDCYVGYSSLPDGDFFSFCIINTTSSQRQNSPAGRLLLDCSVNKEIMRDAISLSMLAHEIGHMAALGVGFEGTQYREPFCDIFGLALISRFYAKATINFCSEFIECCAEVLKTMRLETDAYEYVFCPTTLDAFVKYNHLLAAEQFRAGPIPLALACAAFVKEAIDNPCAEESNFKRVLDGVKVNLFKRPKSNLGLEKMKPEYLPIIGL